MAEIPGISADNAAMTTAAQAVQPGLAILSFNLPGTNLYL
jgi:hypothetical protein